MLNQYLLSTTEYPAQDNGQVQLGLSLLGKAVMEKFLTLKELSMPFYKVTGFVDPMWATLPYSPWENSHLQIFPLLNFYPEICIPFGGQQAKNKVK